MKEKILPFSLSNILLSVVDFEFRATRFNLSEMVFDSRHDFILTLPSPRLAVRMVFANERYLSGPCRYGVRRPVSVTLTDTKNNSLLAAVSITIHLKNFEMYGTAHTCLPIDFDKVDFTHSYVLTVRDEKTGQILGKKTVHFFRQFQGRTYISEVLRPAYAGVQPDFSWKLYKSFDAETMVCQYIRFYLNQKDSVELPPFLPEMEVRVYFPDGSIESKFVTPTCEDEEGDPGKYCVSASIFMTRSHKGVGYAELICFDVPIAGFVFNTQGESVEGYWQGSDIEPLDEYSLVEAAARFKNAVCEPETQASLVADEDFDKALDEFISSHLKEVDEEADDNSESENQPDSDEMDDSESLPEVEEEAPDSAMQPDSGAQHADEEVSLNPLRSLEKLTGLNSVKEKLNAYQKLVIFNKKRQECDLPIMNLPLHAMFWGSPGTGKTTVAKRMGLMLKRAGVLSRGHVVIKERATLLGPHYSNEETNTLQAIQQAQGGILFIDEAYQLYQPDDPRDPGRFVIETLMTALADESKRDWMLILAGYTEEMKRMFEMNPGLKSRIPESNIYIFEDFSEEELMEIAERYLERNSYSLTEDARSALALRLGDDYSNRNRSFGNARHVINLIQTEILPNMATRIVETNDFEASALSLIQSSDIPHSRNLCKPKNIRIGYRV